MMNFPFKSNREVFVSFLRKYSGLEVETEDPSLRVRNGVFFTVQLRNFRPFWAFQSFQIFSKLSRTFQIFFLGFPAIFFQRFWDLLTSILKISKSYFRWRADGPRCLALGFSRAGRISEIAGRWRVPIQKVRAAVLACLFSYISWSRLLTFFGKCKCGKSGVYCFGGCIWSCSAPSGIGSYRGSCLLCRYNFLHLIFAFLRINRRGFTIFLRIYFAFLRIFRIFFYVSHFYELHLIFAFLRTLDLYVFLCHFSHFLALLLQRNAVVSGLMV